MYSDTIQQLFNMRYLRNQHLDLIMGKGIPAHPVGSMHSLVTRSRLDRETIRNEVKLEEQDEQR